ncbi:MAG TPA: flagellar motor protein MotB, partial [Segetibacter sp.]
MKRNFTRIIYTSISLAFFTLSGIAVSAQITNSYIHTAEQYYKKGDYYSAAKYYEKYLNGEGSAKSSVMPYNALGNPDEKHAPKLSREEIIYKVGESYQYLNNFEKAEPYLKDAVAFGAKFPLARYLYAKSLRAGSKFEEAKMELDHFLQDYKIEDKYSNEAKKELLNLAYLQKAATAKDAQLVTIKKLPVNIAGATSAPSVIDSMIFFSSTRQVEGENKSRHTNKLFSANLFDTSLAEPSRLKIFQGESEQFEGASFANDGKRMYVTKWSVINNKKLAAIYLYIKGPERWGNPERLGTLVNTSAYSAQQPYVTPDGSKLYFASDRPGGAGGFDIWVALLNGEGLPWKTINLGAAINSKGDEVAPFFHSSTNTLVFSTNGRTGIGGFDFFKAELKGDEWAEPVNLGYPV